MEDPAAVRELLDELPELLKGDPGLAFDAEVLDKCEWAQGHDSATWIRAKATFRKYGVLKDVLDALARRSKARRLRIVGNDEHAEPRTAGTMLEDCPTAAVDLLIPPQYLLTSTSTTRIAKRTKEFVEGETDETVIVAGAPIVIVGRLQDADDGTEHLELSYRRPDGWHNLIVPRRVALDRQQIVSQADHGFPTDTSKSGSLVTFISTLEAANFGRIPTRRVTDHCGWQGADAELGFLCGKNYVMPDGTCIPATGDAAVRAAVSFAGHGGDEQLIAGVHSRGSLDGWLTGIKVIRNYPRVLLAFYAAYAAPLLQLVRAANFVLDLHGRTSGGKTTTLRLAASSFGNPDEQASDSVLGSWDSTAVHFERASHAMSGLPVFWDESQRAKDPKMVASILYAAAHGRGRSRATLLGLARTPTWHSILFSSGESPVSGYTTDGGSRARCVELSGLPFGKATPETARIVNDLNVAVRQNYGWGGPMFISWLMKQRHLWDVYVEEHARYTEMFTRAIPNDARVDRAMMSRIAGYFGLVQLAAALTHEALPLSWDLADEPLREVWDQLVTESTDLLPEERALRDVMSWAMAHEESFIGREATTGGGDFANTRIPPGGWVGHWPKYESWEQISFYPHMLDKTLAELGYQPAGIRGAWAERGWFKYTKGRKDYQAIPGQGKRFNAIHRWAVDQIGANR